MAEDEVVELFGKITQVPKLNYNEAKRFVVLAPESGNKYQCICPFFCPVQPDDTIYAVCKFCDANTLVIVRPPFVQPSVSKENMVKGFVTMAKMGYNQASKFYDKLEKEKGDVICYISKLAEKWIKTRNVEHLADFTMMDSKKAGFFLAKWHKQRNLRRLYLFGLTGKEIKACEMDSEEIYQKCLECPMSLYGIEIKKALEIMLRNNQEATNFDIRCGQILRTIYENSNNRGWSGTPTNSILRLYPDYTTYQEKLHTDYGLTADYHTVFLKKYDRMESYVANAIVEMIDNDELLIPDPYFGDDIILNKEQKEAVSMALFRGISIITGGPGTGKSTLLSIICDNLEMLNLDYVMCSFTGKAVSRMKELTGREASTIHQLLMKIRKHKDNVKFKVVMIDEFSMVSTPLFYELLKAMKSYELPWPKIIFFGDINQIPVIEWGDLADEMMKIPEIPKVELQTNMRVDKSPNGERCGILEALEVFQNKAREERLNRFNKSVKPKAPPKPVATFEVDMFEDPFDDFDPDLLETLHMDNAFTKKEGPIKEAYNFFMIPSGIDTVYDIIHDVHQQGLSMYDITILSPFNANLAELNDRFEQVFHEGKPYVIDYWKNKWHVGSRVMCLENDYTHDIYNGTEGEVVDFTDDFLKVQVTDTKIVVKDGKKQAVKMKRVIDVPMKPQIDRKNPPLDPETGEVLELDEGLTTKKFMLSYAVTIHKYQGSQTPICIFYLPFGKGSSSFVNRNLTYTAISRAKKLVYVFGDIDGFFESLNKGPAYKHNTLAVRIRDQLDEKNKYLALEQKSLVLAKKGKQKMEEFIGEVD